MQLPNDNIPPEADRLAHAPANTRARAFMIGVVFFTLVVNAPLVCLAREDRSWGALAIMFSVAPIANGIIFVISVALTPLVQHVSHGRSIVAYVLTAAIVPLGAILVDAACIMSLQLGGC